MNKKRVWEIKALFIPTIAIGLVVVIFPWLTFEKHPIYTVLYVYIGIMLFLVLLRSKDSWPFYTGKTFDKVVTIIIWCIAIPVIILLGTTGALIAFCIRRFVYSIGYVLSIVLIFISGIRLRIVGERPKGQFIAIANHCSTIDDLLDAIIMGLKRWRVIYAPEVKRIPFVKYFLKNYIGIPVSREETFSRKKAIEKMKAGLNKGHNLLIFPEGRRLPVTLKEDLLLDFKPGAFFLSEITRVSILPIVISWTFLFKPRSGQWWFSPCTITIYYLDPVAKKNTETLEEFMKQIRTSMLEVLKKSIDD